MTRDRSAHTMPRRGFLKVGLAAATALALPEPQAWSAPALLKRTRVAFIGDQGRGENARAVLELIRDERAHVVLHQGDFDYADDPELWDNTINDILGSDFPYFACIGNHDRGKRDIRIWYGYQEKIRERWERVAGVMYRGDPGYLATVRYRGLTIVISGVGTYDRQPLHYKGHKSRAAHAAYVRAALATAPHPWRFVSFHKNQRLMQVGRKRDETGWGVYEEARKGGAIVATGHSHTYSRSHTLSRFGPKPELAHDNDTLRVGKGTSFAFVNGLGGSSLRNGTPELMKKPWWGCVSTADNDCDYGALFLDIGGAGNPRKARGYFKDIQGRVIDTFQVENVN